MYVFGSIFVLFALISFVRFKIDISKSYKNFDAYAIAQIETELGTLSYIDEGSNEAILFSHGIFGGYDHGYHMLNDFFGDDYRKIAPSRFGYPGSDMVKEPTPKNQAKAYLELLDELGIEKVFVVAVSAGGAAALQFTLDYPERVHGLILLSSGMPKELAEGEELGMTGPPSPIVNDFAIWFTLNHFGFVMEKMMGSTAPDGYFESLLLPVNPRRKGINNDTKITNVDMITNYHLYPIEDLNCPILVIHAKDDPMASYDAVEEFSSRTDASMLIFEEGGHLITGHQDDVNERIRSFVEDVLIKSEQSN